MAPIRILLAVSIAVNSFRDSSVNAIRWSNSDDCEALVKTESGLICGRIRLAENATEYYSFRGVPYGKPPLGELRFLELQPAPSWDGIRDASIEGPVCPQKDLIYGNIPDRPRGMSEDCIYANIHVPKTTTLATDNDIENTGTGLPILVFIHGGGFHTGSGNSDLHGPEFLMHLDEVMVVTFNYRINVFGFLSLNNCQIPGNAALRDQIALLKWVKRNAIYFGGNPDDVTLMGQSAGATCAHLLTLSKAAEGLFNRVFLMSGTAIPNYFTSTPAHSLSLADKLLDTMGYETTDPNEKYRILTTLSLTEIMTANDILHVELGMVLFMPVVEPKCVNFTRVLDDNPINLIAEGRGKDFPMIIGFVENEGQFFKWVVNALDIASRAQRNLLLLLSPRISTEYPDKSLEYAEKVKQYYSNGTITVENFIDVLTDLYFQYPAMKIALWRAATNAAPVYLYQFSYVGKRNMIKEGLWLNYDGVAHVEDLTYVYRTNTILGDHISFPPKTTDDKMRAMMSNIVLNFIRCSNPTCNIQKSSLWPRVSADNLMYLKIAEPEIYSMETPTARQRSMTELLDSIDSDVRNVTEFLLINKDKDTDRS